MPADKLLRLKTLLHIYSAQHPEQNAEEVSRELFFKTRLCYRGVSYEFACVEFYFDDDPYCHRHREQYAFGKWYFHKVKTKARDASALMMVRRLGVDITFGDGVRAGGILIRALRCEDGTIINGPARVLNHLFSGSWNARTIVKTIHGTEEEDAPIWKSQLRIIPHSGPYGNVHKDARVGLRARDEQSAQWAKKPLRFSILPLK
ncbi:hypothetical protein J4464_00530 [Candidatus Woesearchaeota archaeon]|nr:hypothetical protein [Candidatus Woesearchaeota archaeon]